MNKTDPPYTELYKQMTISTIVQWHEFIRDSSKAYTNFITNTLNGWKQYQEMTDVIFIKEMEKTLNNTTIYQ